MITQYEWQELNKWLNGINLAEFTGYDQGAVASWYSKVNNTPYHRPCSCSPQTFLDWLGDIKQWVNKNRDKYEPRIDVETQER